MKQFKFTKASVAALFPDPAGGRLEYRDTIVNGLVLRVGASGVKSFCISRKRNGKFIRATLERFPDLTIENARAKALDMLGEVATNGKNPNDVRRVHAMSRVTLEEALQTYIDNRGHRLKPVTAKQYQSILGTSPETG